MHSLLDPNWEPPVLIPRDGGYDTLRGNVVTVRLGDTFGRKFILGGGPDIFDSKGYRIYPDFGRGPPSIYPLTSMAIDDYFVVKPFEGHPNFSRFQTYLWNRGRILHRKFKVTKQEDGSYKVLRLALPNDGD